MRRKKTSPITHFNLSPGRRLGRRYVVESLLGKGVEGEVYQIREMDTSIVRAAKLYFPHRNPKHRSSIRHAQKLNRLRHCPIVLQYHHSEMIQVKRQTVVCMISDLAPGMPLDRWVAAQSKGRLNSFVALHVLYHLARGLEAIHALGEYHADVHSQNILIQPRGVRFEMKLIDFYDWGRPTRAKLQQDIMFTLAVFYEILGGKQHYGKLPESIRYICAAMRRDLILKRFPTMTALRQYLENFEWEHLNEIEPKMR